MYSQITYKTSLTKVPQSDILSFNNLLRHSLESLYAYRVINVTIEKNESEFTDEQIVHRLALLPFKGKVENKTLNVQKVTTILTNDFNIALVYSDIIFLKSNNEMTINLSYNVDLRQDAKSNPVCDICFEIKDNEYMITFKVLDYFSKEELLKQLESKIADYFAVVAEWTKA